MNLLWTKYGTIDDNVKEAASKLKGPFLNLINSGVHEGGLNPITSKSIYKAVVLPKALYGCELWYSLQSKHIDLLEKAHKFSPKTYKYRYCIFTFEHQKYTVGYRIP